MTNKAHANCLSPRSIAQRARREEERRAREDAARGERIHAAKVRAWRNLARRYREEALPLQAINAEVMGDLVQHHSGRRYPVLDVPRGDLLPKRFHSQETGSAAGSPGRLCAEN